MLNVMGAESSIAARVYVCVAQRMQQQMKPRPRSGRVFTWG